MKAKYILFFFTEFVYLKCNVREEEADLPSAGLPLPQMGKTGGAGPGLKPGASPSSPIEARARAPGPPPGAFSGTSAGRGSRSGAARTQAGVQAGASAADSPLHHIGPGNVLSSYPLTESGVTTPPRTPTAFIRENSKI